MTSSTESFDAIEPSPHAGREAASAPRPEVFVSGISVWSAAGSKPTDLLQACLNQTRCWDQTNGQPPAARIADFEPKQHVRPRKALKVMCREIQLAFATSQLALQNAGLLEADGSWKIEVDTDRVATIFGSEMLYDPAEMADAVQRALKDAGVASGQEADGVSVADFGAAAMRSVSPLWLLKYLPNMPACHVGISLGATGPNNTLVVGDISGPAALSEAVSCLQRGHARLAVVTASGNRINETRRAYHGDTPLAGPAVGSDAPAGVVCGEASATIVLETMDSMRERGASPLAQVQSVVQRFAPSEALTSGSRRVAALDRGGRASAASVRMAVEAATQDDRPVACLVGHACGDPVMDQQIEEGLQASGLFEQNPEAVRLEPMRHVGHSGAASGAVALAVAAEWLVQNACGDDQALCISTTAEGATIATRLSGVARPS